MSRVTVWAVVCGVAASLLLTGCRHRVLAAAAPLPPVPTISVPPPTHHFETLEIIETEAAEPLTLEVERVPLPKFRPRPTTARQLALLLKPAPSSAPAMTLGELTTGGEADNSVLRQETRVLLQAQQQRLQALTPAVKAARSRDVAQATLFLSQATEAWRARDVEGARVLATKAKVLLDDTEH